MTGSQRSARAELWGTLAVWLALVGWAWLAAPVGELPRSTNSWDVLQSGRRFAEQGFLASRLQPVWAPPNHRSQFLTYTHYPPLPHWIGGVVEGLVQDPAGRIDAMLRLVLVAGISAVLCGHLFLRAAGIGLPAAALACLGLVASRQWWPLATGELTWVSWLQLFQLGGVAALGWTFARGARAGPPLALACAAAAALSAFDAWPWFPTLLAALAGLAALRRRALLLPLVLAAGVAGCVSLGGAAARLALNWWHFGTFERTVEDAREAYSARSVYAFAGLEIAENRANYMELPKTAHSHAAWVAELLRGAPGRLAAMFLPEAAAGRWLWGAAALLAVPGWLWARRRPRREGPPPWPGPLGWLVALALAPLPFVLACPAISVQQGGALLAFTPAALLAAALVCEGALAPLLARAEALPLRLLALALALAAAAAAAPVVRGVAPGPSWPAPLARCQAAVQALSRLDGVVFVDLDDVNPLIFLAPLDAPVSFKPLWTQALYLSDVRPLRILRIAGQGRLPERELAKLEPVELPGLPEGFELLGPRVQP